MKIEKINDNQIKCTLNKSDLASREIKISELAYGTQKAKELFRDMMQQAAYEFGFEAEDIPLMIEAIPVSPDCIVLLITKVEDPEELDTRFSKFAPAQEEDEDGENSDNDVLELLNDMNNLINHVKGIASNTDNSANTSATSEEQKKANKEHLVKCFKFNSLNEAITACHLSTGLFKGESALYKDNNDKYYIYLDAVKSIENAKLCNIFSEYSSILKITYSAKNYYDEHYECIIPNAAIEKLSKI
ncbi:MAG: adaptor protein MecA [Lachnospiraceae bacterium]|nr:adaptor protein MecA [Lachnospiraceae bacterium]MBQ4069384.1 adaptor protein MecA [Lachnospiraceae bacterium]